MLAAGESSLGPEVKVTGLTHAADTVIRFRARAIGSGPTTVQVRAWAAGQPEPTTWNYTATDSSAALQVPGAVGVLSYLGPGATSGPMLVRVDDLLVTTTDPIPRVTGEVLVAAGDIASCTGTADEATDTLLKQTGGSVATLGDNVYPHGTAQEFANCYDPSWGQEKSRTYPAIGNHEYDAAADAGPYFDYFAAAAAERAKGWYAFDLGTWRVYVLNSNCSIVSCVAGSEQEQWLRADIAANPRTCSMAIWHHPRFSSGCRARFFAIGTAVLAGALRRRARRSSSPGTTTTTSALRRRTPPRCGTTLWVSASSWSGLAAPRFGRASMRSSPTVRFDRRRTTEC